LDHASIVSCFKAGDWLGGGKDEGAGKRREGKLILIVDPRDMVDGRLIALASPNGSDQVLHVHASLEPGISTLRMVSPVYQQL
jgi:hypothetical protein